MSLSAFALLCLAALSAAAPEPAVKVPQLERRAPYAGGGFALVVASTCPAGYQTLQDTYDTVCCPPNTQQTAQSAAGAMSCCTESAPLALVFRGDFADVTVQTPIAPPRCSPTPFALTGETHRRPFWTCPRRWIGN